MTNNKWKSVSMKDVNCVSRNESEDSDDDNNKYIYAYMPDMSGIEESSSRYFGDSSQLKI